MLSFVRSFSVASLMVCPFWFEAFKLSSPSDENFVGNHFHYERNLVNHVDYLAAMVLIAVLTAAMLGLERLARHNRVAGWACTAAMAMAVLFLFSGLRILFADALSAGSLIRLAAAYWPVSLVLAVAAAIGVWRWWRRFGDLLRVAVTVAAPLGAVLLWNGAIGVPLVKERGTPLFSYDAGLAPPIPAVERRPRTVVMVFDAWGYRSSFEERPPDLEMPEVDRLRRESFFATDVSSVGDNTVTSLTGLFTGTKPYRTERTAGLDVMMYDEEKRPLGYWGDQRTFFHDARRAGLNAVYGGTGFMPICKLFREALSDCVGGGYFAGRTAKTVIGQVDDVAGFVLMSLPGVRRLLPAERTLNNEDRRMFHGRLVAAVKRLLTAEDTGFAYIHFYCPHPHHYYDRHSGRFVDYFDSLDGYYSGLALVDRTLGELRRTLEQAGLWHRTNLILTADHGRRRAKGEPKDGKPLDPRVPLIIKLAGSTMPLEYGAKAHAVDLRRLLRHLFRRDIVDPAGLARFFDAQAN